MLLISLVMVEGRADTCEAWGQPAPVVVADAPASESSGLAASRSRPGVLFTHDDAGGQPQLYAIDLEGRYLGAHFVRGAALVDWEDLAPGPCPGSGEPCLYIGDIGDNDANRSSITIYVVEEPEEGQDAKRVEVWEAVYPAGPRDAETLLVHPCTGDVYLVTKTPDATGTVYKLPREGSGRRTLEEVATLVLPDERSITGGQWDADGDRLVIRTRDRLWEWRTSPLEPDGHWDDPPVEIAEVDEKQGESVAFTLEGELVTSDEGLPLALHVLPCHEDAPAEDMCAFEGRGCGCASTSSGGWASLLLLGLATRRRTGAVIWGIGAVVAAVWAQYESHSVRTMGVGFSPPVLVSPLESGRLATLSVQLHTPVRAGEVVASIDPALVEAELEVAQATLLATRARLGIEVATETRRFAESAEGTNLTRAQLSASIREDEALLQTLQQRLAIEDKVVASGAVAGLVADDVRWQIDVVEARLRASRSALHIAERAVSNAEARNAEAPGVNEWEIVAAVRAVELIERRRGLYDLTSGIDGHVTAIYASPGSMVTAGLPLLEIRSLATREVVAYAGPADLRQLVPGESAFVERASGEKLAGQLVSVGGSPQMLPLSLWPFPNEPRYGVPVRIELQDGEVAPDEPVWVSL